MAVKPTDEANGVSPVAPLVIIKSAGEMASAIACRLHRANIRRICMLDLENPLCVRREVSFCPALETGDAVVEQVVAKAARTADEITAVWDAGAIAVTLLSDWQGICGVTPDVVIDAILAKRNLGTSLDEAELVIALGPGFEAGIDCHLVIETNRGHDLGRILETGMAAANTGVPGNIAGETANRILRAPCAGVFRAATKIGHQVRGGDIAGYVGDTPVKAKLDGMVRGLIRSGTAVSLDLKLGDIDPRGDKDACHAISDKARAISGSVLESVMRYFNRS